MNKLFLFALVFVTLIVPVMAIEQTIITTALNVTYVPNGCTPVCNSVITIIPNTTNTMNQTTCVQSCSGVLQLRGENLVKDIPISNSDINQYMEYSFIREMGNISDVTNAFKQLSQCLTMLNRTAEQQRCIDDNQRVSLELAKCNEDRSYKTNFTECDKERANLNLQLSTANSNLATANQKASENEKTAEEEKTKQWWFGAIGLILGIGIFYYVLPKLNQRTSTRDALQTGPNTGAF